MVAFLIGYFAVMVLLLTNGWARNNGCLMGCGVVMVPFGLIFIVAAILAASWDCETC